MVLQVPLMAKLVVKNLYKDKNRIENFVISSNSRGAIVVNTTALWKALVRVCPDV